jgi:hypothetical protein
MKSSILLPSLLLFFVISSCKKEGDETPAETVTSTINIQFKNEVDGAPISSEGLIYTNAAQEAYSIDLLKYYISYISLTNDQGVSVDVYDHKLIDALNTANNSISVKDFPDGNYTNIVFHLGVDHTHNHTGDQPGDLDPINGMLWTWNTGYIFFKHEGMYTKADGTNEALTYHLGTDATYTEVTLPLSFTLNKETKTIELVFNLNELYRSPVEIGFEGNNFHQSTAAGDADWMTAITTNIPNSFSATIQ